jgi:hypothetical protein
MERVISAMIEDENDVRETAREVLGSWVDGDKYFYPGIPDIVERLVEIIKEKGEQNDRS